MKSFIQWISICTALISIAAAAYAQDFTVRIMCNQPIGNIKHNLVGAAQGGDSHSYSRSHIVTALSDMGIRCVRLESMTGSHFFKLYDPATKQYDFTRLDAEINAILNSKAEIIANIFYVPEWLSSDPEGKLGYPCFAKPADWKKWQKYVYDIVKHCKDKGFNIKYWEIWNEPSGGSFFTSWGDGVSFNELYRVTAKAIKQADKHALVGGIGDNMDYPEHYLNLSAYLKKNKNVPFDFITVHWYSDWEKDANYKPENFFVLTNNIQSMMQKALGKKLPIFVTEWNGDSGPGKYNTWDRAAYLGQSLYWMQESNVDKSTFFRIEPYAGVNSSLTTHEGIWRYSGRIMKMFSLLPKNRVNVSMAPRDTVILGAADNKSMAAFISRASDNSSSMLVELHFQTWFTDLHGKHTITIYTEDAASADQDYKLKPVSSMSGKSESGATIKQLLLSLQRVLVLF